MYVSNIFLILRYGRVIAKTVASAQSIYRGTDGIPIRADLDSVNQNKE